MRVLIAENNPNTMDFLNNIFSREGFDVLLAENGTKALEMFKTETPDFVCLDIMMPDMSGYDVCKEIRKNDENIPVVFISAKNKVSDKVVGLELGADDFITKPFDVSEVIARIRAIARRCMKKNLNGSGIEEFFTMGNLTIYPKQLKAKRGEESIDLSLREIKILKLLHDHKNEIVSRDKLLDFCWGMHIMPESRTVAWHISQLRKRIEPDPKQPALIKTVHGVGYKYEE